jgi:hypothetical protein
MSSSISASHSLACASSLALSNDIVAVTELLVDEVAQGHTPPYRALHRLLNLLSGLGAARSKCDRVRPVLLLPIVVVFTVIPLQGVDMLRNKFNKEKRNKEPCICGMA